MDNLTEKSCENCAYYIQHYIIDKFAVRKIKCGHCTKVINKKTILCKNWTKKQDETEDKEVALKKIMQKILSQLEKIILVLNMDNF